MRRSDSLGRSLDTVSHKRAVSKRMPMESSAAASAEDRRNRDNDSRMLLEPHSKLFVDEREDSNRQVDGVLLGDSMSEDLAFVLQRILVRDEARIGPEDAL